MNHFLAIKLSLEAQNTVHKLAEEWRGILNMHASWYAPGDYHITLKFLGGWNDRELVPLYQAVTLVAAKASSVLVHSAPAGGFPDMRAPSVLWAGVQISQELDALVSELDNASTALGFRSDKRRYQPHITLARCRVRTRRDEDWPLPHEHLFAEFKAKEFVLMQTLPPESRAKDSKARYNIVHTFPFGG